MKFSLSRGWDIDDFKIGDKVFIDSFAGLVPGVVTGIHRGAGQFSSRGEEIEVRLTSTLGAYKKGEKEWHGVSAVVQRAWVHKRKYSTVIIPPARNR